jgi:hypothetical protein
MQHKSAKRSSAPAKIAAQASESSSTSAKCGDMRHNVSEKQLNAGKI